MKDEVRASVLAYMQARERGDEPSLEELIRQHPEHAADLVSFAAELFIATAPDDPAVSETIANDDLAVERAALDAAFTQRQYATRLTSLLGRAKQRGFEASDISAALGLGIDVIHKLDMRMIEPASIPEDLCRELSTLLDISTRQLTTYFSEAAQYAAPQGKRQQLQEAVRASPSTPSSDKARWTSSNAQTPNAAGEHLAAFGDARLTVQVSGSALKEARQRKGIDIRSLAQRLTQGGHSVDTSTVLHWQTATSTVIGVDVLEAISRILGVRRADLEVKAGVRSSVFSRVLQS